MTVIRVEGLPAGALEAAARFHALDLPKIRAALEPPPKTAPGPAASLAIVFPPAPYDHRGWRLAAVQDLARAAAPRRVNGVVGDDAAGIDQALAYLEAAPGVTGQLLAVDGKSAQMG